MTKKQQIEVDGRELTISNLDKVFFPESGFTKGEVIEFYSDIAEAILPHLRDRPLTLKRYPDGITGEHFYEKNAPKHTPPWVKRFAVPRSEGGPDINYVLCNDRATLVWATNLGDIEKHVLLAHAPELNRPTSVVFDLDPGEPAGILDCGEVALHLKKVFDALKLESFVKVSGSKGLHLAVPLNTEVTYEATQPFAKAIAELVMQQLPDRVVSEMAKTLRRGKVLIDWSQNSDFKTTVCVYAMRAKDGGAVHLHAGHLGGAGEGGEEQEEPRRSSSNRDAAVKRIKRLGDLFAPVLTLEAEACPRLSPRRSPPVRRRSFRRGRAIAASPARITTKACANMPRSGITPRRRSRRRSPWRKRRKAKAFIASSSKSTRPVICTTTGGWKCRACCARGRCRKGRRRSCGKRGSPCTSKITRSITRISRAPSRPATTARAR